MKIKVCGMRNSENITDLVKLNPDYIGFIFYGKSKRYVKEFPEVTIPKAIKKVGVFVNETIEGIVKKVSTYNLQVVQLHGNETPQYCKTLKCKFEPFDSAQDRLVRELQIIKAFAIDKDFNFEKTTAYEKYCNLFLFDTKGAAYGGNGVKYDWNILQNYKGKIPYLLSGGISENDAKAILSFQRRQESKKCIGVDVNSGFEDAPAVKNIEKLKKFITNVRN